MAENVNETLPLSPSLLLKESGCRVARALHIKPQKKDAPIDADFFAASITALIAIRGPLLSYHGAAIIRCHSLRFD